MCAGFVCDVRNRTPICFKFFNELSRTVLLRVWKTGFASITEENLFKISSRADDWGERGDVRFILFVWRVIGVFGTDRDRTVGVGFVFRGLIGDFGDIARFLFI